MDTIDRQIISLLSVNPRMSAAEIGRAVHRSRVAVSRRIDALLADGEIEGFATILRRKPFTALFEVQLSKTGKCDNVVPRLRLTHPSVSALSVTGDSDLFILVEAMEMQDISEMRNTLLANQDVANVRTHAVTKAFR